MKKLSIAILTFLTNIALSQQVSDVRASLDGNNVVIQYNLTGSFGQTFKVDLHSSYNNFSTPLRMVSGDIGENVSPGLDRRVVWEARKELRVFSGDIEFEIRAEVFFSPLRVTTPVAGSTYKGGKSLGITWRGGNAGERLTVDIMRDGRIFQSLGSVINTGNYAWIIPKKIAKSDGYSVRLTSDSPGQSPVSSQGFTMKKKGSPIIPIAVVVAVAAAAVAGVVLGGGGTTNGAGTGGGGGGGGTDNDLPDPPDPPGG
jgi:hypothetical protein